MIQGGELRLVNSSECKQKACDFYITNPTFLILKGRDHYVVPLSPPIPLKTPQDVSEISVSETGTCINTCDFMTKQAGY